MNIKANIGAKPRVRILTVIVGVLLIAGMMTGIADAATSPTNITITGGTLNMSAMTVADFANVTLTGTATTGTTTMNPFTVTDARGNGGGWNITVQATQFKEYSAGAYVVGGRTLALSSLSMVAPTVAANGTSSAVPSMTAGPYIIDSGGLAVKIASAALNSGMGAYNFTPGAGGLTLSIPANVYATTYRSDVTVSVVSGP